MFVHVNSIWREKPLEIARSFLSSISSLLKPRFIYALIKFQVSLSKVDCYFSSQGKSHVRKLKEIIACDE